MQKELNIKDLAVSLRKGQLDDSIMSSLNQVASSPKLSKLFVNDLTDKDELHRYESLCSALSIFEEVVEISPATGIILMIHLLAIACRVRGAHDICDAIGLYCDDYQDVDITTHCSYLAAITEGNEAITIKSLMDSRQ